MTSIGYQAFYFCSGLTSVTIPDSVTSIGGDAFYNCSGLTSVTIPDSVTSIGEDAFAYCSGLTSVTIPDSVTSIGSSAFSGCSGLTTFSVGINNPNYSSANGLLLSKDGKTLIMGVKGDVVIPNGVTSIGDEAFDNCYRLTSVTIPDSVTSIGEDAFYGCGGLTSVMIPDSVTSIGTGAFYWCSSLTSVTIPDSVTSIGDYAFADCGGLTLVAIGNGVTHIGAGAFEWCSGLTSVTIPDSVTSIGDGAFQGCGGLTSVTIPDSVTSIGAGAFSGCSGLTSVTIPDSVTNISYCAFRGCSGLTSVTIPNSVTRIDDGAFQSCSSLTSVIIPDSVTSIGFVAFQDCSGLISVTFGNGVTSIGSLAFDGCSRLISVTIPNLVTSIRGGTFRGCSGLTSMTIPDSVTSIGEDAFSGCSGLTSVTIPDSVTSIDKSAFSGCSGLTSVTIPDSVTSIGDEAFDGCNGIRSVIVSGGFRLCDIFPDAYSFITNAVVSSGVTSIGSYAFSGCKRLTGMLTIPDSVTSIGEDAFSGCSGLTSVTIPNSVTSIGEGAFRSCSGLKSVSIPASVMNIVGKMTVDVPGLWVPGLRQVKFNSRYDTASMPEDADESDVAIVSGAIAAYTKCDEYNTSFSDPLSGQVFNWNKNNTTFVYFGQMWMVAGKTYVFGAHFDDDAYVKVDGQVLVNIKDSSEYNFYTGRYECRASGWHDVEFRLSDNCDGKGPWGWWYWSNNFGLGYRDDGLEDSNQNGWKHLLDPGDGSLFHTGSYGDRLANLFPDSLSSIETVAFLDGVAAIPDNFFEGCTKLKSMDIPDSVVEIGTNVFEACSALATTTVDGLQVYQGWVLGVADGAAAPVDLVVPEEYTAGEPPAPRQIRGIAAGAFRDEYDIETVTLPESLRFIGAEAFKNCTGLEEIAIPEGVWKIDRDAFRNCTWAHELSAPSSLRVVGDGAFANCASLLTAVFEDGLECLGADAFQGDWRMLSVSLPHSVTNVAANAFAECDGIRGVTVPATVSTMAALFPDAYAKIETAAVAAGETEIMDGMFAGCQKLADFTWAGSETNVGERAFQGCGSLTSVAMPGSVVRVGASAFENCTNIRDVTLSRSLEALPDRIFAGCPSLDSFVVPASVTSIGDRIVSPAPGGWSASITAIYYLGNAPAYNAGAYSGITKDEFTTYVVDGSRGWDGTPTSRVLPRTWLGFAITSWTPNRFDVAFDANGGYFDDSSVTQWAEQQITDTGYALPNQDPVRPGYAFDGWWTEPSAGAQVRYSTKVTATRPHTIYAHWRSLGNLITATFNANGGTVVVPGSQQYIIGQTFGAFPVPSRRGYAFDGWWTATSGGERVTESSKVPAADMELFAHWSPIRYKVHFDANGGSGTMQDQWHTYDAGASLKANSFTWTGHAFSGWALTPYGQVVYANGATVVNLAETQDEVVTLYAVWSGAGYNVRFDANGGSGVMDSQTIQIGETRNLHANLFVWPGREFLGWATTSGGAVAYRDGEAVRDLSTTSGATVHLYAVWRSANSTWRVEFDANGGNVSPLLWSVAKGETLYALPLPTRPGFTFDGWWTQASGGSPVNVPLVVTSDMTLHAHWSDNIALQPEPVKIYTVTFNANGGTGVMAVQNIERDKVAALRKNSFARTGYVFAGWATSAAGSVAYANVASVKNLAAAGKTVTLYAQWAKSKYTVKFNAYGGKLPAGKKMATQTMAYGKAAKLTKNAFTRKGYVFAGWATSKANAKKGVIAYKNAQSVSNLRTDGGTTTLYAVWAKKTYKVAFYANGGKGTMAVESFTYGKAKKLTANKFKAPKGKKFVGWATSKANAKKGKVAYKNKKAVKNLVTNGKTVKLYAVWKKK